MASEGDWEVDFFIISTTTQDSHTDRLYANGLMQVPVVVTLGAIDKKTSESYPLQDSDLDKIGLYDFENTDQVLNGEGDWIALDARNPNFASSIEIDVGGTSDAPKETSPARAQVLGAVNTSFRTKLFWVSSKVVGSKRIAARVRQPDNTLVKTQYSAYNSNVKINAVEPIVYTVDNINVAREDTGNGNFNYYTQNEEDDNWYVSGKAFDQDNYYVTSKLHRFVLAEVEGHDKTGYGEGHPADWRLANCYGYYSKNGKTLMLSFIWGLDVETKTTAGLYRRANIKGGSGTVGRAADGFVNMTVNQRPNAVCLTRLALDAPDAIWGENWSAESTTFTVYDVYGNSGKFTAGFNADHNLVAIS